MPTTGNNEAALSSGPGSSQAARDFIAKWGPGGSAHGMTERAGAQAHFIELCTLLGVPTPDDPERYTFERGLSKTGGTGRTDGFADVWLKGCFAWEYKAPGKKLEAALSQLMQYALALESPPLLVVSDRLKIEVHTHFTGTPSERHVFLLEELGRIEVQARLRKLWTAPESFRPARTNRDITEQAAETFAGTAERLRNAGVLPQVASHFLTQCVFCFFAEDVGLLPSRLFERLMGTKVPPERLQKQLQALFETMRLGGLFGVDDVPWFNGGLFATIEVPILAPEDVTALKTASGLNWSAVDPSILGTLFERGLDPAKRSQLGAHYTDPTTIMRLVRPVVEAPLLDEWQIHRATIEKALAKSKKHGDKAWRDAQAAFVGFLERLKAYRVLDPACGSGNFLYLGLKTLKDIEHRVNLEAEELGLERQYDVTGPHNVLGIELNEYAAELARVTVWIGELQWRIQHGYGFKLNPILEPLDHIECRDAVLGTDGHPARWPAADALVGNPPFLGNKRMRAELGDEYAEALRRAFSGRVESSADLVCYWFDSALHAISSRTLQRAGLVATNSIRSGANRQTLERITDRSRIFEAWSDVEWVNEGAAVRVSLVAFGISQQVAALDGKSEKVIGADLSPAVGHHSTVNVSRLPSNAQTCFMGMTTVGRFEVAGDVARSWLSLPNPNGRSNSDVLFPWANGMELARRPVGMWTIDFGTNMSESEASLYEAPFKNVNDTVRPIRASNNRAVYQKFWWRYGESRPKWREVSRNLPRFIATVAHSKYRLFVWMPASTRPDHALIVTARSDDATLGVLQSRLHEVWSLRLGSSLEDRPRYTPTTCFETFPFPAGLTPEDTASQRTETLVGGAVVPAALEPQTYARAEAIACATHRLVSLRDRWLNPPEWTERVPEVVPVGMSMSPYPDRIVARPGYERELAKRTLTNLYNLRPAWLAEAHAAIDAAVARAYGWQDYFPSMTDEEVLRRLLALNQERQIPSAPRVATAPKI